MLAPALLSEASMRKLRNILTFVLFSVLLLGLSVIQGREAVKAEAQNLIQQQLDFFSPQITKELFQAPTNNGKSPTLTQIYQQWKSSFPFVKPLLFSAQEDCAVNFPVYQSNQLINVIAVCFSQTGLLTASLKSPQSFLSLFLLNLVGFVLLLARQKEKYKNEIYLQVLKERDLRIQMTQSLIHDLKSPLQSLQIFSKNVQVRFAEDVFLFQAIDRLQKLIRDLAQKNQAKASSIEIPSELYSLDEFICEFEHRDARIQWIRQSREMTQIFLDGRLIRLLQNIFENSLEAESTRICIEAKEGKSRLLLQISDNGRGITTEKAQRLGREPLISQKPNGSGQGLFLLCEELRQYKIDARFFSATGEGMMVQIEVPRSYLATFLKIQA